MYLATECVRQKEQSHSDVGFPPYAEYVLLPLVYKETALVYSNAEYSWKR